MDKNSKSAHPVGKLITFNPTGEYYFSKGIKAYYRRDYHKSLKYLQRAMQLEPGEPMIVCQLAIVFSDIGEYKKSNELLHLILEELDEGMVDCYYFLANNYAHLGFFKDAYYHAKLYISLAEEGEFVEETEDLMEILSLESDDLDNEEAYEEEDLITRQEQARNLLESGNFLKAIEVLDQVIKDYPEYWSAHNNLALAHFYLGNSDKANQILEHVLENNNGNLHALCNKVVFAFYEYKDQKVKEYLSILQKIKPISIDHQYKLGTTFALVGDYESAFFMLHKLQKRGFIGDTSFYYWLSYSAYFTGREQLASEVWKRVVEESPEKEGHEPWNKEKNKVTGFEDHFNSIIKKMESKYQEERMFAMFLTSVSNFKEKILSSHKVKQKKLVFSQMEKEYFSFLQSGYEISNPFLQSAHMTAEIMYKKHRPIGTTEASLYLNWFSVFIQLQKEGIAIRNNIACAAAMDYLWHQQRNMKVTQQEMANRYGLSISTVQKYVKMIRRFV